MVIDNTDLVEKFNSAFKLKESPIAFFYTDNPPQETYSPKEKPSKRAACIIQLLNGVRSGNTLVFGKDIRNFCPGGLAYLGFKEIFSGLNCFLSTGIPNPEGEGYIRKGERFVKTPELGQKFIDLIPFQKAPSDYAVFMPLNQVNQIEYEPLLIIFFVKMDQLAGLIQLANYETLNRAKLGIGSGCSTILTEPLAELENGVDSSPIIGQLTDILARSRLPQEEASFTVGYEKLVRMYNNIDESFLKLEAWKQILNRI